MIVRLWPTADVRVDRVDLRLVVPQSPETAVDESGGVSPGYSQKFSWNRVSDNTIIFGNGLIRPQPAQ